MNFLLKQNGYCHCCRSYVLFESYDTWLRDNFFCNKCRSIPRQRAIQYILDKFFPHYISSYIHESSPSNNFISQYCTNYSFSHFFEDVPLGKKNGIGIECQNIEKLTYEDNIFDIFITQEVMEHIFNPNLASKEIMRVLKPGGVYIFTVGKWKKLIKSYPRARLKNDKIDYLCEPEYHGNPIGNGRSLVTWYYGDDFEQLLSSWTSCVTTTYVTRDLSLGIDGEFLEVFVIRKSNII
jgi:SAM-dependent methyltransferase